MRGIIISSMLLNSFQIMAQDYISTSLLQGWEFKETKQGEWMPAVVPGTVQQDLMANGVIPDPYPRNNEREVQWVEKVDWEYRLIFDPQPEVFAKEHVELVFKGLDTYAKVFLNGEPILEADNMFLEWRIDVKKWLRSAGNELLVVFNSPIEKGKNLQSALGYDLPAPNDQGDHKVSIHIRKAPYQFGWDWGPRLVTAGIWRNVSLEGWDMVKVVDWQLNTQLSDNYEQAILSISVDLQSDVEMALSLSVDLGEGNQVEQGIVVKPGSGRYSAQMLIDKPRLWWPHNHGEPNLYDLSVSLNTEGKKLGGFGKKIGIRKVELIREAEPKGESFFFKINGKPVFMKGANYIPQDNMLPAVTNERYDHMLQSAKEANMNMLRVWGGGIYENDYFYEKCDELGLMVWQDFMFACSMYPGDSAFLDNVRKEVAYNVRRLRNHPSLVHWNGNNEIDVAWHNWGWQIEPKFALHPRRKEKVWEDYSKIFKELIPNTIFQNDASRGYTHTSPLSNWGKQENFNYGSMHYWGVWHGADGFEGFKKYVGRFMSEYGFQSFPEMETIRKFADEGDLSLDSEVMRHHQKSYVGNGMILKQVKNYYPEPKDFAEFVYLSQLTQADAISYAVQHHRTRQPHCMGTLFWQLDDCWPGPSWSSIDYYGVWKALHYHIKKQYQNFQVFGEKDGKSMSLYIIDDQPVDNTELITLKIEVVDFGGKVVNTQNLELKSEGMAVQSHSLNLPSLMGRADEREHFIRVTANIPKFGKSVERAIYLATPAELKLSHPIIDTTYIGIEDGYHTWELKTDRLAKSVQVSLPGVQGNFSDNYFDLFPGRPVRIKFYPIGKLEEDLPNLVVRTIK